MPLSVITTLGDIKGLCLVLLPSSVPQIDEKKQYIASATNVKQFVKVVKKKWKQEKEMNFNLASDGC